MNIIGGAAILAERRKKREAGVGEQTMFLDGASNFHPYECNGPGHCIHCDRLVTPNHDPGHCALCQWYDEEEDMVAIQDVASKLKEIAATLGALDFSQEVEDITNAVASIQSELQACADALIGGGGQVSNEVGAEEAPAEGEEEPA